MSRIKPLSWESKGFPDEKKAISELNILKQRELAKRIAQLSEDIEVLRSEKAMIFTRIEIHSSKNRLWRNAGCSSILCRRVSSPTASRILGL